MAGWNGPSGLPYKRIGSNYAPNYASFLSFIINPRRACAARVTQTSRGLIRKERKGA